MLATVLPSHAGDGAAEANWLWRNVDVESCWRHVINEYTEARI
jgi:hypothetical protein